MIPACLFACCACDQTCKMGTVRAHPSDPAASGATCRRFRRTGRTPIPRRRRYRLLPAEPHRPQRRHPGRQLVAASAAVRPCRRLRPRTDRPRSEAHDPGDGPPRDEIGRVGFGNGVFAVAYSPNGATLLAGSIDGTVRLIDAAAPAAIWTAASSAATAAFDPTGRWVVTGSSDQTLRVLRAGDATSSATLTTRAPSRGSRSARTRTRVRTDQLHMHRLGQRPRRAGPHRPTRHLLRRITLGNALHPERGLDLTATTLPVTKSSTPSATGSVPTRSCSPSISTRTPPRLLRPHSSPDSTGRPATTTPSPRQARTTASPSARRTGPGSRRPYALGLPGLHFPRLGRSSKAMATQCPGQPPHERREHRPVRPVQAWPWVGATQDGDLVT